MTLSIYHAIAGELVRFGRGGAHSPSPATLGPQPVDLATVGTVRTATTAAGVAIQVHNSAAGDTVVVADGSHGNVTLSRNLASGFIRVVPANPGGAVLGRVDLSNAQGLDIRGMNTLNEVYYSASQRIRWRGGIANLVDRTKTGHNVRALCVDLLIEDATINDADCSFFLYADRDAYASTQITIRRCRSNNVGQDHVFGGRGTFVDVYENEFFGHTEDPEHQDSFQVVGLKDFYVGRNHFWNTRAFRDAAVDRNDHGAMVNYDPAEVAIDGSAGRKPERGVFECNLIHDMTSNGLSVAGGLDLKFRYNTVYDCGPGGSYAALSVAPDAGNTITILELVGNVFNRVSITGATITTNSHNHVTDASGPAGTSRTTGDPGFVDRTSGDYRLAATSLNRGSGLASATVVDLYGRPRPTPPSRGAIEYAA